ncbi:G-type lectin S-receptor-like serine/threonine-protein kinase At2g19130 [Cryptomeria japonica]|uniref:G-type lectin S-receptor-like serine/threonine-protein kinase At2g19130 n=1 Tax=Cryptomeria japonica TaxID=3369 RepID=UPI0027DAB09A|nr:G-type lectin S-receptor-like serine/threonine-protein kinase At2g19130 [Cryptomeria japonica]
MGNRAKLCFTLFLVVTVFSHLKSYGAAVEAGDTLSLGASLAGNQTIFSKNGTFELGFFSPNGSNWYIGIWYAKIPEKTIVWVANRETPARNRSGVLKLSREGNLVLFDTEGASIWSVNMSKKASRAVILDSGNFLMLSGNNKSETVWQCFDNPLNAVLPGMRFGGQQKLVSWKNSLDPAPGLFSLHVDPSGAKQFVVTWNNSVQYWETGTWEDKIFSGLPGLNKSFHMIVESSSSGLYFSYTLKPEYTVLSRYVLTKFGGMQVNAFVDGSKWNTYWSQPGDACASPFNCDAQNSSTERFVDLSVTLANDYASSCTAFSFSQPSGPCQIWSGDSLNMRNSPPSESSSNVSIRVGASEPPTKRKTFSIVGTVLRIVGALTVVLGIFSVFIWRRNQLLPKDRYADSSNSFLRMFSYEELKIATRNFKFELALVHFALISDGRLSDFR